jgi:hypothetical protein
MDKDAVLSGEVAAEPLSGHAGAPSVVADAGRPVRPRPRPIGPGGPMVRYGAPPIPDDFV